MTITEFDSTDRARELHLLSLDEDNRRFVPDEVFETEEEARDIIATMRKWYDGERDPLVYPLLLKESDTLIGYVQVVPLDGDEWEIGYHIGKEYTGRGYATEAVCAFAPAAIRRLRISKLHGICLADNTASQRVLEKAGFVLQYRGAGMYQGVEQSICRYLLVKAEDRLADAAYIRREATKLGADVCGFSSIERFSDAPQGFHPTDIWSPCRSVVCFGVALPTALLECRPDFIYAHYNGLSAQRVDDIAFRLARRMEEVIACKALPLPCDTPYEAWDPQCQEGRGLLSVKHAAVAAGLGTLGKNTMLINPRYGNRLTLGVILCDIDLPSDSLLPELCIPDCQKCLQACPAQALDGRSADQSRCRPQAYGKSKRGFTTVCCNQCRAVCPLRNGVKPSTKE